MARKITVTVEGSSEKSVTASVTKRLNPAVLQVVVSKGLRKKVEKLASKEDRSISKMSGVLIKKGLEALEAEQRGAA